MNTNRDEEAPQPSLPWHAFEETVLRWRRERRGCPGDDALAIYFEGLGPLWQRLRVWWHVRRCALCRADLTTLHEVFAADVSDATASTPLGQGRLVLPRRGWHPAWAPVLAGALLLSLAFNAWQVLAPSEPAVEPPHFWAPRGTTNWDATGITQYIEQGDGYVEAGEERKALQAYQQALDFLAQEYPFAFVLHKLAARYATPGYTQQAIDAATAALILDPDDALAYRYRGLAYEEGGERPQAIRDLQRAARLNDPEAQRTLHAWGIAW